MNIRNIIFDLGGVIINLDYDKTTLAFQQLGLVRFREIYSQKKQDHFFDDFEKGTLSEEDFRKGLKQHLNPGVADADIDAAWNAMLLDIPPSRIRYLESLKSTHRIFLLSNTNCIHETAFTEYITRHFGEKAFEKLFEKVYYSCRIGMRKPDAEIFNLVLSENGLKKEETIFIDDSIQHVEGANQAGIQSFLLTMDKTIEQILPEILGRSAFT